MPGVNKVIVLGRVGRDPESRTVGNSKVVSFSLATSETWNDKATGERKERTQWHRVVIWNDGLGNVAKRYLRKGFEVYLEGALETRKYTDKDGAEREITEIVLRQFRGELALVGGRQDEAGREKVAETSHHGARRTASLPSAPEPDADEIPF